MSDEVEIQTEEAEEEKSIWEILGVEDPDAEEPHAAEEEIAEAEAEKEDKLAKKVAARVDNLEKKFKSNVLRERTEKFLASSDELERDLFKAIAGDVKDPETLDRAIGLVHERATKMKEEVAKYEAEMREKAEEAAKNAWGVAPVGVAARTRDDEDSLKKRIESGDTVAGLAALMEDDSFIGGRL